MSVRIHKAKYGWGTVKRVGYGVPEYAAEYLKRVPEHMMHLIIWDQPKGVTGGWYEIDPDDTVSGAVQLAQLWENA